MLKWFSKVFITSVWAGLTTLVLMEAVSRARGFNAPSWSEVGLLIGLGAAFALPFTMLYTALIGIPLVSFIASYKYRMVLKVLLVTVVMGAAGPVFFILAFPQEHWWESLYLMPAAMNLGLTWAVLNLRLLDNVDGGDLA